MWRFSFKLATYYMENLDSRVFDLIKEEMLFNRYSYTSLKTIQKRFEYIYSYLEGKLDKNLSTSEKKKIKETILNDANEAFENFYNNLNSELNDQSDYFKEKNNSSANISNILLAPYLGYTLYEALDLQKRQYQSLLLRGINLNSIDGFKSRIKTTSLIKKVRSVSNTFSKAIREEIRDRAVANSESKNGLKGWVSIAVLDNRTTKICRSLDNKFYPISKYSRLKIPNRPPRHFNCRSILSPVYGDNLNDLKKLTIKDVFESDKDFAKLVLGNSYDLYSKGEKSLLTQDDIYGNRYFTLNKIKEVLS